MAKKVYLIRHGDVGCLGRYIGSSDPPLTALGRRQLLELSTLLVDVDVDRVYCSPMRRCRQSLELLSLLAPATICEELREIDFGTWEGKTFAEIVAADGAAVTVWAQGSSDFTFPGGERLSVFHQRVLNFWRGLQVTEGTTLVVVTHGGIIRHLLCQALDLPWDKYLSFDIGLGTCATLTLHGEGGVLTGLNLKG